MIPDNIRNIEIEKQYQIIDYDWLKLHYKTTVGIVAFSLVMECLMSLFFAQSGLIHTTMERYILKYIIVPSGINITCVLAETLIMKSKAFTQKQKIYCVSLLLVLITFVLFTVHSAFTATYYIFPGAIMMTILYADYRLTGITASLCIWSAAFSEILIKWDSDKITIFESSMRMGNFLISMIILIAFSAASMVVIRFEQKKNLASIRTDLERHQLKQSIQIDELTRIYNRKALDEAMADMEVQNPLEDHILAVVDIDNFKNINDRFGHYMGDRCLIEFARVLMEKSYNYTPYRYGGDEFCLLFHNTTMEEAVLMCEEIRQLTEKIRIEEEKEIRFTASFGLSAYSSQLNAARLFVLSDYALYDAKKDRNSVRVYEKGMKIAE
ncbi:GGDEF domain-containing protein [Clostridium boliviensis]|uniref:GGDEF domain-containing protein n=1 Tax=Clostridium boliviensis TaxID=318465 RepID=A0ABU4GET8_9CLOT|nr:GGDEF domain-containing protein [Clostridium boliviensis]MDW2796130.1 GGDEF domain-containing protein [Clostridium boliviensis]